MNLRTYLISQLGIHIIPQPYRIYRIARSVKHLSRVPRHKVLLTFLYLLRGVCRSVHFLLHKSITFFGRKAEQLLQLFCVSFFLCLGYYFVNLLCINIRLFSFCIFAFRRQVLRRAGKDTKKHCTLFYFS